MQAFHLDTNLSKGIKANRGFKTIDPLSRFPWLNVPFLWIFFTITDISSRYKLASHSAAMTLPQVSVIPLLHSQISNSFSQSTDVEDSALYGGLLSCTCFFGLWTQLCWCHFLENRLLSLYCNRLPVITCSWWSCTSGWAPQSEWVDMIVGPVLLGHMSARRGRCTVPGHT